jgi:septum formation protein
VLASASSSRRRLLDQAGIEPWVLVSGVDEEALEAELAGTPPAHVARVLAQAKAEAVVAAHALEAGTLVLGCDSVFEFDGEPLGKPLKPEVAAERIRRMQGSSGILWTGHCVIDTATGAMAQETVGTLVTFAAMRDEEIAAYVDSGEPLHVAGGFTLDGLSAPYVDGIQGDPGNVIGLSLPALRRLLHELGLGWLDIWQP